MLCKSIGFLGQGYRLSVQVLQRLIGLCKRILSLLTIHRLPVMILVVQKHTQTARRVYLWQQPFRLVGKEKERRKGSSRSVDIVAVPEDNKWMVRYE